MSPDHLLRYVIRPTLDYLELGGRAAEQLILGTAIQESRLEFLHQLGRGPALGLWQMEPATHDDLWRSYLVYRESLAAKVRDLIAPVQLASEDSREGLATQMRWNLSYGCAMARVLYRRDPVPLPPAGDTAGQAAYWKRVYNTRLGKGRPEEYERNWQRVMTV